MSGKTAKKNKENDDIRKQNKQLIKERDEAVKQARTADDRAKAKYESDYRSKVEKLKVSFNKQVDAAAEKRLKDKQEQIDAFGERFAEWVQERNDLISKANTLQMKLNYRDDTATIVIKMLWNMLVPFFNAVRDLANRRLSKNTEFTEAQAAEIKGILQQFSDKPKEQKLVGYMLLREANKKYYFIDVQYDQCEREMERVADNEYNIGIGLRRR